MIVDVGKLLSEEREREREKHAPVAGVWRPGWQDEIMAAPHVERNVIVAMLMGGAWLEACDDVTLDDFTDLRYRAIFRTIRELQETGADVDPLSVADAIALDDMAREAFLSQTIDAAFLGELLCEAPRRESPTSALSQYDRARLRVFTERRRSA